MPITIFCSFTRRWAIDRWLDDLSKVEHDPKETNLCAIIDCDEVYILTMLKKFAEPYRSFHYRMNENWHPNEVRLAIRRARVAEVMNQAKDLVSRTDGEVIIGLEDDTVFDRLESFEQLYRALSNEIGFVEGVQVGRWGANMIGAWRIEGENSIKTLTPPFKNVGPREFIWFPKSGFDWHRNEYEKISAGGLYGYATHRDLFLNHEFFSSTAQPWGPDVNFGIWINKQGYKCLINWHIVFGHQDHESIAYPESRKLVEVSFNKNLNNGKWDRTDTEEDRY